MTSTNATQATETIENQLLGICKVSRSSRPTKFAASSWLQHERACPLSSIRVAGIDRDIPIPISTSDMSLLKEQAGRAPFGFGPQTVTDQTVRDAWQIDGRNVWSESQPSFFQHAVQLTILTSLKEQLGLDTDTWDVHATLYKMLLYEEGGHFLPHRDTEKEPGMFGTYLLQLPVEGGHEGGQLCVRHRGEEVVVDTSTQSSSAAFQEVMFYADCEHELKVVTGGRRCVLAFNLNWRTRPTVTSDQKISRKLPADIITGLPSSHAATLPQLVERVKEFVARWVTVKSGSQKWFSIPLHHKYTIENLSFDHLKGKDMLMVRPFMAIPSSKLAMYLVLERITFLRDIENDGRNPMWMKGDATKEMVPAMDGVSLSMISRNGNQYQCANRRGIYRQKGSNPVYRLHALLHRLGDDLVLDAMDLDAYTRGSEYTGNESQPEERTYFRCLLLLTPKRFEEKMLDALDVEDVDRVPTDAVNYGLKDSDSDAKSEEEGDEEDDA